ncbi:NAD(P)/FAD-dependent oxidoreductase [Streptomyces pactum]|uniref:NAD(P)/FAD-dependent oxidoreductase n=1 Tax=Streptomyces pactum TaxID=68249 RepID=UPI0036F70002
MTTTGERNDRHRVVVIGGGMAGARLAQQLAGTPEVALTLVGEERHAPYNRVLLAEVLAGRYPPDVITLPGSGARRLSGVRAVRIDRAARAVHTDDGRRVPYDTLVLATGAGPVLPPLRGLFPSAGPARPHPGPSPRLPAGVRPLRTLDDCLALDAAVRPGLPAVVIGGGLLGVSAARALARRGARVVLVHPGPYLMERQLDAEAARLVRDHLTALGVRVRTGCRAHGLRTRPVTGTGEDPGTAPEPVTPGPATAPGPAPGTGTDPGPVDRPARPHPGRTSGRHPAPGTPPPATGAGPDPEPGPGPAPGPGPVAVRAVELADGTVLDARLTVLACGVRPRVELARDAGIVTARGVVVDDELRTSDPDVFAVGDCAEHAGVVHGFAGPAQDQADLLALVIGARAAAGPAAARPGSSGAAPAGDRRPPRYTGSRPLVRLTLPAAPAPPATPAATTGPGRTATPAPPTGPGRTATPAPPGGPGDTATPAPPADRAPLPARTGATDRPDPTAATAAAAPSPPGAPAAPVAPLDLAAFGEPTPAPGDDVVQLSDATRAAYRKVVVRGDRLVGGVLLGDLGAVGALARAWEGDEPLPAAPLLHLLTTDGGPR